MHLFPDLSIMIYSGHTEESAEEAQRNANSKRDELSKKVLDKTAYLNYKPLLIFAPSPGYKHQEP